MSRGTPTRGKTIGITLPIGIDAALRKHAINNNTSPGKILMHLCNQLISHNANTEDGVPWFIWSQQKSSTSPKQASEQLSKHAGTSTPQSANNNGNSTLLAKQLPSSTTDSTTLRKLRIEAIRNQVEMA